MAEKTFQDRVIELINEADECEAGHDRYSVIRRGMENMRTEALDEALNIVDELFSVVGDLSWNDVAALKRKLQAAKRRKL